MGTFLPSMKINGRFSVSLRLDQEIKNALNMPGFFIGQIINRANIGLTSDELVAMWDAANPGDPVTKPLRISFHYSGVIHHFSSPRPLPGGGLFGHRTP